MKPTTRGMTLLELMIASAIAAVIMLGLGMVEGTRARVTEAVRQPLVVEPERKNAALAALRIAKDLETTDRFEVDGANQLLNVRLPDCPTPVAPSCFDNVANYQWVQYRLITAANELRMYRFARVSARPLSCPTAQGLAREITAMTFTPTTNGATYSITWTSPSVPTRNHMFRGQVITRFRPDQAGAPVTGLDVNNVSPPPGVTAICN